MAAVPWVVDNWRGQPHTRPTKPTRYFCNTSTSRLHFKSEYPPGWEEGGWVADPSQAGGVAASQQGVLRSITETMRKRMVVCGGVTKKKTKHCNF